MSEPIPNPVILSDEQMDQLAEKVAVQLARYLPTYLLYRDPPVVPAGSVVAPQGVVVTSQDNVYEVEAKTATGVDVQTIL